MEVQYKTRNEKQYNNYQNKRKNSRIIINNIPDNYTNKEIQKLCEEFGKIDICKVKTGNKGKYAFVKFSNEEEAKKAIEKLKNKEIETKKLYVKEYRDYHHNYPNYYYNNYYKANNYAQNFFYQNININNINIPIENNNLYVKNIPYVATEEDLRKTFEKFGKITSIKLEEDVDETKDAKEKKNKKFINKTFGYISFEKVEDMNLVNLSQAPPPMIYPTMQGPFPQYPPFIMPMNMPINPLQMNKPPYNMYNRGYGRKYNNNRGRYRGGKNNNQKRNENKTYEKEKKLEFDYKNFNALKSEEEKKDFLGEKLFELIHENQIIIEKKETDDTIGKITGMIMGIPNSEIIEILENPSKLSSRIEEALKLLEKNKK